MDRAAPLLRALASLAALVLTVVLGLAWTSPPAPVPADASPTVFSSGRARAHIEVIARSPHRIGSPENDAVAAYLLTELQALGLQPELQRSLSIQTRYRPARLAMVKNVVARIPGRSSVKPLLLVAHYDSRSMTPGASDDGYGVATLLETARALRAQPDGPGQTEVIFLFTDGEEEGLLGAHAALAGPGAPSGVGLVLNFEARGNSGPVLMFQTGNDNGALVGLLSRAAPWAAASSLSAAVYRRMPNDTDLSEWLPLTPALNFANIGGFERYHAPTDTPANIDEGTLQQHGAYALGVVRALAAERLPLPREQDATFFDVGALLVRYPGALELPLAALAVVLLGVFVVVGRRRGVLRARYAGLGLLAVVGLALAASAASALLWALAIRLHPDYRLLAAASPILKRLHLASFLAVAAALVLAFQARLLARLRAVEILAGALAIFAGLAVALAIWLPGGGFLFTWPVLVALPPAFFLSAGDDDGGQAPQTPRESTAPGKLRGLRSPGAVDRRGPGQVALAIAASAPGLFLVAPFVPQLFAAFGPDAAPVLAGLGALLVAAAAPALQLLLAPAPRAAPLVTTGLAAVLAVAGNLRAPFDRDHPRPDTVFFGVDADARRSFWLTPDSEPPPWAAAAFAGATRGPAPLPFPLGDLLAAPTSPVGDLGPEIAWFAEGPPGPRRVLRVVVYPRAGAEVVAVRAFDVISARVEGTPLPVEQGVLAFRFYAPSLAGIDIELVARPGGRVTLQALSQSAGLPYGVTPAPGRRPPDRMAKPGMMPPWDDLLESDMTIVGRSSSR